jgi:hypothetical protein
MPVTGFYAIGGPGVEGPAYSLPVSQEPYHTGMALGSDCSAGAHYALASEHEPFYSLGAAREPGAGGFYDVGSSNDGPQSFYAIPMHVAGQDESADDAPVPSHRASIAFAGGNGCEAPATQADYTPPTPMYAIAVPGRTRGGDGSVYAFATQAAYSQPARPSHYALATDCDVGASSDDSPYALATTTDQGAQAGTASEDPDYDFGFGDLSAEGEL